MLRLNWIYVTDFSNYLCRICTSRSPIRHSRAVTIGMLMDKPEISQMMIIHAFSIQGVALASPTTRESTSDARSLGLMEARLQYTV